IVELLWWLQYLSMQPGGLAKWSAEFIANNADRIGTPTMHKARVCNGKYSFEHTREILREVPARTDFASFYWREQHRRIIGCNRLLDERGGEIDREQRAEFEARLKEVSQAELLEGCRKAAEIDFPHFLQSLCTDCAQGFTGRWYFRDLIPALFAAMDDHA